MANGYLLSEHALQELRQLQHDFRRLAYKVQQFGAGSSGPQQDEDVLPIWKNESDTECPAGGCVWIDDYVTSGGIIKGKRPNSTLQPAYGLNGVLPVAAGGTGQLILPGGPLLARMRADVVAPSKLKSYGPKLNSWEFTEGLDYFFSVGTVSDNIGEGFFQRPRSVLGKPDSTISKGGSGTVSIWSVVAGVWADTGINAFAHALGAECTGSKYCAIEWQGEWVCGPAECAS